jgi:hypothetical protein
VTASLCLILISAMFALRVKPQGYDLITPRFILSTFFLIWAVILFSIGR